MKFIPRKCQTIAAQFVMDTPACALFLDMGLGKTATILQVLNDLLYNSFEIRRVLIIAPKRVATIVWPEELQKWDEFKDIRHIVLHGTKKHQALQFKAKMTDVMVINYEGLQWLAQHAQKVPIFDMIVMDESTYVKSEASIRFKLLATFIHKIPRRVIMSGKPAPNGLQDLWSQYFLLDGGERLGEDYKKFLEKWFAPVNPYSRKIAPYRHARKEIANRVRDITLNMRREDYIDLPGFMVNEIKFDLPPALIKQYKEFEHDFITSLPSGDDLQVFNAAAMGMKLRQFVSGFVYTDEELNVEWLHKKRLGVLKEIREANPGKPLLIAIQFREEVDMIRKQWKKDIPVINSTTSDKQGVENIQAWNRGSLQELIVHPASVAHGLNMQHGGNLLVLYSQTWNLDHYDQLIKRLDRPGQKELVVVHSLIARGTIDEVISAALQRKDQQQEAFLKSLQEKREIKHAHLI